jgi:hypothetical protein
VFNLVVDTIPPLDALNALDAFDALSRDFTEFVAAHPSLTWLAHTRHGWPETLHMKTSRTRASRRVRWG